MKAIVYVLPGGLQFCIENQLQPIEIRGRQQNIKNELGSWKRFRDNINEETKLVRLKICWCSYIPDALMFCMQVFPDLASFQVELLEEAYWRIHYSTGKDCVSLGPVCLIAEGDSVRKVEREAKDDVYVPQFEECFSVANSCKIMGDECKQMEIGKEYLVNKLKKMQTVLKRRGN